MTQRNHPENIFTDAGQVWPYRAMPVHSVLLALAVFLGLGAWWMARYEGAALAALSDENGPLENTQIAILTLSALVGVAASLVARPSLWRLVAIVIACIAVVGWTREIQSYHADSQLAGLMLPRWIKRVITSSALGIAAIAVVTAWWRDRRIILGSLSLRFLWPMALMAGCLGIAQLCEGAHWVLAEEGVEVVAYLMLLTSASWILVAGIQSRSLPARPETARTGPAPTTTNVIKGERSS